MSVVLAQQPMTDKFTIDVVWRAPEVRRTVILVLARCLVCNLLSEPNGQVSELGIFFLFFKVDI